MKEHRDQLYDGEPFTLQWKKTLLKHTCCECDLTHKIDFQVDGDTLTLTFWRDERSTAARRRKKR